MLKHRHREMHSLCIFSRGVDNVGLFPGAFVVRLSEILNVAVVTQPHDRSVVPSDAPHSFVG
jgi:hypothetical protein